VILSSGRFGNAPYRTPQELSDVIPVVAFLLIGGFITPIYPSTDRSKPSRDVGFSVIKPIPSWVPPVRFPLWIQGRQWERFGVAVLTDPRVSRFRGSVAVPPVTTPVVLDVEVNSPDMRTAVLDGVPLVPGVVIGQTYSRQTASDLYPTNNPQELKAFFDIVKGIALSYIGAGSLSVNSHECTAVIRIGDFALTPTRGPRTSGASDYTCVGSPHTIAASIRESILDTQNPFFNLVYPIPSVDITSVIRIVTLVPGRFLISTSDQTVSIIGA
jgi:hypothetical protein